MGQFSYCCAVCDQEILHGTMPGYQKFTEATILFSNGDKVSGEYDGYGSVGWTSFQDLGSGQAPDHRIMHTVCYKGQPFGTLTKGARHAQNQGWWPGERAALALYGEPNMAEIKRDTHYVCLSCHRAWKAKWSGGACPFGCSQPTCAEHGVVDYVSGMEALSKAQDAQMVETRALRQRLMEERGISADEAHNLLYKSPDDKLRREIEDKHNCEACAVARQDIVVPFEMLVPSGNPNALGVCFNDGLIPRMDQSPRKCYAYGQKQIINTKRAECYLCHSSKLTVIKVADSPLAHLAVAFDNK